MCKSSIQYLFICKIRLSDSSILCFLSDFLGSRLLVIRQQKIKLPLNLIVAFAMFLKSSIEKSVSYPFVSGYGGSTKRRCFSLLYFLMIFSASSLCTMTFFDAGGIFQRKSRFFIYKSYALSLYSINCLFRNPP